MTYHRVCYNSRTTGAGRGTGTVDPSGAHEFIPYAQFYVPPEQINKCMPIFKLIRNHCTGGSLSVHMIMKTSSNVENILGFNGQ